ncbi:hypothetical protein H6G89_07955 [Oscillatoria sp. FACHB-1407]|uniref:DALR anticodon-binding domain-containing protein n=1 Tax=Oscillatoria sp. FACHB-1407 TaxID=2692847 RepID=UPI00168693F3|nr:DALR anticodon-binding domain-containing protein [Oscillatoria sp. FACHB-1407]MBD2460975.1 hypothetical protein [Oscillatoria sp. FACHB-1407]
MNSILPIILPLALRSLLLQKLQKSILLLINDLLKDGKTNQGLNALVQTINLSLQVIPIQLVKPGNRIKYVSAIAPKLSKSLGIPITALAYEIKTRIANLDKNPNQCNYHLPLERVWENFTVNVNESGWIYLQLNEVGTAFWVQQLLDSVTESDCPTLAQDHTSDDSSFGNFTNSFIIQYTHARCCSLLYLAHQEGFVALKNESIDFGATAPQITTPNPFPWLDIEHRLRLHHPAEQRLITQCVTTLDCLADMVLADRVIDAINPNVNLNDVSLSHPNLNQQMICKLAQELSLAFQTFYATCRIWGETSRVNLELTQARLGLVALTQMLLRVLLQEGLEVIAPCSL